MISQDRQNRFGKVRWSVKTIKTAVEAVNVLKQENHYLCPAYLLENLDVRNVCNSARWRDMLETLEETFNILKYRTASRDYLNNQDSLYETIEEPRKKKIIAEIQESSMLGPDLWNLYTMVN